MEKLTLQEMFSRPIAYHRIFAAWVGVTGAVFLSQAIYWNEHTKDKEGWFYKTREEWYLETGLSRSEQETARKRLVQNDFLNEKLGGNPARMYYQVNWDGIQKAIDNHNSWLESNHLVGGNPTNKVEENQPTIYTETTTEITNSKNFNTNLSAEELLNARSLKKAKGKVPFSHYTSPRSHGKTTAGFTQKKGTYAEDVI